MSYKAILFDMDGLLVDTEGIYIESERELAAEFEKVLSDLTIQKMMGHTPRESLAILAKDLGLTVEPEELVLRRDAIVRRRLTAGVRPMPGAREILEAFQKFPLGLATGNTRDFMDRMLLDVGFREFFSVFRTSENVSRGKPDPQIYREAAKALGFSPEECVALEDSENGARSAKSAGCYTVAVPSVHTAKQTFPVDFIARDLFEARAHIYPLFMPPAGRPRAPRF